MALNKTEKTPYLSRYGGGYVRPDQWITEKLCEVIAKKKCIELPDKFWNLSKWGSLFRRQVQMASSLLVMYDAEAVYKSLKDKRLSNVRSFGAFSCSFFSKVLDEYQSSYEAEKRSQEESEELAARDTRKLPTYTPKQNKLSRLKEIDGETRPVQSG
tara:strand:+ start:54 stop:524 length:471 start_codon:yes stop_codon:yes gene_type:complete